MPTEIQLPDYLKSMVDSSLADATAGLITTADKKPRISTKGRKFRIIEDGEEVAASEGPLHITILAAEPEKGLAKAYYESTYVGGAAKPPSCSSRDGISPDTWVEKPLSDACMTCEKNAWGSATSAAGKPAKACKDSKKLLVARPDNIEGNVYELSVAASSLKKLSDYGKTLASNHVPMAAAITSISFADAEYPLLDFEFNGILKEDVGQKALQRAESKDFEGDAPALSAPKTDVKEDKPKPKKKATKKADESDSVDDLLGSWG